MQHFWLKMTTVTIDKRERALARMFRDAVQDTLDAGDIQVQYPNGGMWIAERKTADDLAASLRDGRSPNRLKRKPAQTVFFEQPKCIETIVSPGSTSRRIV